MPCSTAAMMGDSEARESPNWGKKEKKGEWLVKTNDAKKGAQLFLSV